MSNSCPHELRDSVFTVEYPIVIPGFKSDSALVIIDNSSVVVTDGQ